jgi:spermidine/putrescine transport system substrate-binding protein
MSHPRPAPLRLTRRARLGGVAAAAAAQALGGCASRPPQARPLTGAQQLRVLTWPQYIYVDEPGSPGTVTRYEQASGATVDYEETWDNETSWNDVLAPTLGHGQPCGYDIVVPTYWVAARMVGRGWAEPVPLEAVPNHVNLDPAFLTMAWDRGAAYHLPWQAGITGIAYNPGLTGRDIQAVADLYAADLKGRVGLVRELRETMPLTMLMQGADPSRPTQAAADRALDQLEEATQAGQFAGFTGNEYLDDLRSGRFAACLAWSGDIVQLQRERPDIRFVIPAEGGIRWFDTMVIPRRAVDLAAAASWMNFVYDPPNAARITAAVQYISPVLGVQDELRALGGDAAKLADSEILFPSEATRRRLYTWGTLDPAVEDRLQARFDRIAAG